MNWPSFLAGAAVPTAFALFRVRAFVVNAKAHHYRMVRWHYDRLTTAVTAVTPHLTDPRDAELVNVFLAAVERAEPVPPEPTTLELLS